MTSEYESLARRGYAALNEAYRSGDVNDLLPLAREVWDPGIVLSAGGAFPETGEWHGYEGVLRFISDQMEAFTQMWIEPEEFVDTDGVLLVECRFGGRARSSGIEIEFAATHVLTIRDGKAVRIEMYPTRGEALAATKRAPI